MANGGGTTWVTGSYDPSTDLLYWGVANPSPLYSGDARPGDNLFTNSVIALHASTGKMAWYFQFTPHDEHDWDSAQTPILADLMINGEKRKVICWLNRNGFYYILDRCDRGVFAWCAFCESELGDGTNKGGTSDPFDPSQGNDGRSADRTRHRGGTNWQNPAFDQKRGLVFVPAALGVPFTQMNRRIEWFMNRMDFTSEAAGVPPSRRPRGRRTRRSDRPAKMGVHIIICRRTIQWSLIDRGRVGIWGGGRSDFCLGCGDWTRSLAPSTWRKHRFPSNFICH